MRIRRFLERKSFVVGENLKGPKRGLSDLRSQRSALGHWHDLRSLVHNVVSTVSIFTLIDPLRIEETTLVLYVHERVLHAACVSITYVLLSYLPLCRDRV